MSLNTDWWKIMSRTKKIIIGVVVFIVLVVFIAVRSTSGIVDVANKQLDYLKAGDFAGAYALTSRDFQSTTSLDDFKYFVAVTPALNNNESASFSSRSVENSQGMLKGTLKSQDGTVTPVEYSLVKEDGKWKILSIQFNSSGTSTQEDTKVDQILISDEADARGIVSANKTDFLSTTTEIFVSASISSAAKDSQASALLIYLPTGDELGPAVNDITESGDLISSFSFTKPTAGWPEGTYKVVISLSTGETNETLFNVANATVSAATGTYSIGSTGPGGGIVFYDAGSQQSWGRYLEAAPYTWNGETSDPFTTWGCRGTSIPGATGTAIGTGQANTTAILAGCPTSGIAAQLADALTFGSQSDWFLPSQAELGLMKTNKDAIGGFATGLYWSSSEMDADTAWPVLFDDNQYDTAKDFNNARVRPVRAFG